MSHVAGSQIHTKFILDPGQALRLDAVLDRMSPTLLPPRPVGIMIRGWPGRGLEVS